MTAPERFPEGRLLTVELHRQSPMPDSSWWWELREDDRELATSPMHPSEAAATEAAREVFGGWLGSVIGIDLKRTDGTRERLR
ncbi:hypothetical protein [Mycolicibacterium sp.]|uniref:hypothetical protein n=1 Tax=Mycolicibacterium sp. TaxID=2320850 RepID=UPI0037C5B3D4